MWYQRLPRFNGDQLHYVEYNLVVVKPRRYKEIALQFRKRHPGYAPDVDEVLFIDLFTHKCRQMINDPRWASSSRIAEARKNNGNSGDLALMSIEKYRLEGLQAVFDKLGDLYHEVRFDKCDTEKIKRIKIALSALTAQSKMIFDYEKGLRDQQRIDKMSGGIPHINLPVLDDKGEILEKWRRLTHRAGRRPVDAGVWEIQNGRNSTTGVPAFTPVQQAIVISCLINCEPHREIARLLQHLETPEPAEVNEAYQGIIEDESIVLPEGMPQAEYEEKVIKRCKDYASNKNRKWYEIIKAGREEYSEQIVKWVIAEANYVQNLMIQEIVHKYAKLDIKDVMELADKVYGMREVAFDILFGEDDGYVGEDTVEDEDTYAEIAEPHPLQDINDTDTIETV